MTAIETGRPPSPYAPLVLVVDDDPDARDVARGMLHLIGYRTRAAHDALEALRHLRAERPAAVLLDLHMPGLDGFGFLDRARREVAGFDGIPVFVASGVYRDVASVERPLLRRKVWAFVQKPFTVSRLREGMRDFLDLVPPHPPDPARMARYAHEPAPAGTVVHLSSPGIPAAAIAEATRLAAAKRVADSAPPPTAPANRRVACVFDAAIFAAGAVLAGRVIEAGPEELEFVFGGDIANAGDRVVVRAKVEGAAFHDLRLLGTVVELHKDGPNTHLTIRLEGDRHAVAWEAFLSHLEALGR